MENNKNELEVQETKPDFLKGESCDDSLIEMDKDDIIVPVIKLDKARNGYINDLNGEELGDSLSVIAVKQEKEWCLFDGGLKLISKSRNGETWDNGTAISEEEKWKCLFWKFYVLLENQDSPVPFLLSFGGTSSKTGKTWVNALSRMSKLHQEPIYARAYTVGLREETSGKLTYLVKTLGGNHYVTQERFTRAKSVAEHIKTISVKSEVESEASHCEADTTETPD